MSLLALLQQKKAAIEAGKKGRTIKLANGRARYRVLPSWRLDPSQPFWHDFGQHFVKATVGGDIKAIYICTDRTFGRPCAVCDQLSQAISSCVDDNQMKVLEDAKSGSRVLLNVLALDSDKPTEPQILECPPTVFNLMVEVMAEWEEAGKSIIDVNGGMELVIGRTGTGKNTEYTLIAAATNKSPAPGDAILKKLNNLDEYVKQESEERQNKALTVVRGVAGLLSAPNYAPSTPSGLPLAASGAATLVEEDDYAAAAPPPKRAAAQAPAAQPVVDVESRAVASPAPAPAPAAAPAVAASTVEPTGDEDLDNLLSQLGA